MGERENNSQPWLRFADLTLGFEKLIAHALRLQQDGARPLCPCPIVPTASGTWRAMAEKRL